MITRIRRAVAPLLLGVAVAGLVAGCTSSGGGEVGGAAPAPAPVPGPVATSAPTTTTAAVPATTVSTLPRGSTTTTTAPDPPVDPPRPVPDPEGGPWSNSVLVVGDSVALGTTASVPDALPEWLVTYDAEGSRRLAQAIDLFAERRHEVGHAVVIHLGNNFIQGERGTYASQIDEAMAVLADVPIVVWVTVAPVSETRRAINDQIRLAPTRWANVVVADWAPLVEADPALSWDGIHLTPQGRRLFAELVADALGAPPGG